MNLLKHLATTTVLLSMSSNLLAANNQDTPKATQPKMSQEEMYDLVMNHFLGDMTPLSKNPNRFIVQGSFIYWQADVDGIDYGLEQNSRLDSVIGSSAVPSILTVNEKLKTRDLDFKWDPGFKAGIGIVFGERDEWDLFLNWTWYQTSASRNVNFGAIPDFTGLPVLFGPTLTGEVVAQANYITPSVPSFLGSPAYVANTHWRLHYNTVDLELGRNFFMGKKLTVRPHIGLRGAFIHQHTKINYQLGSTAFVDDPLLPFIPVEGTAIGTSQFKASNEYDSLGVRGGLDVHWNFTNQFCVYGNLAGAIQYGRFDIDQRFDANAVITTGSDTSRAAGDTISVTTLNNDFHRTRTNLQAIIGFMWHTDFNDGKDHVWVSAGYEVNEWFNQNELSGVVGFPPFFFTSTRTNGDLGLHGLTLDVRFDF